MLNLKFQDHDILSLPKLQIQLKYHMMSTSLKPNSCSIQVMLGIVWLKGTKHQKKASKNVMSNSTNKLKEIFSGVEKELSSRKGTPFEHTRYPFSAHQIDFPSSKMLRRASAQFDRNAACSDRK
jgi:hypothetical protein